MAELLEGGGQAICSDFCELADLVKDTMKRRKERGEEGYRFASAFTLERFEREWLALIQEVVNDDSRPH